LIHFKTKNILKNNRYFTFKHFKVVAQLPGKDYSGRNVHVKTIILSMSFYVNYSREVTSVNSDVWYFLKYIFV